MPILTETYRKGKSRLDVIDAGLAGTFIGFALVGLTVWWLFHRGYDPTAVMLLAVAAMLLFFPLNFLARKLSSRFPALEDFAHGCVIGCMILATVVGLAFVINQVLYKLPAQHLNWLAVAVLPGGYLATLYKRNNQMRYGIVEVMVGVITALSTINQHPDFQAIQGITLIGTLYVVARGFTNIKEAQEKAKAKIAVDIAAFNSQLASKHNPPSPS